MYDRLPHKPVTSAERKIGIKVGEVNMSEIFPVPFEHILWEVKGSQKLGKAAAASMDFLIGENQQIQVHSYANDLPGEIDTWNPRPLGHQDPWRSFIFPGP